MKKNQTSRFSWDCGLNLILQYLKRPHSSPQTAARSHNYATNFPLVTMGRPTSTPKITPFRAAIANPIYLLHPWMQPTHHPKRHPDPISRFSTVHRTDQRTGRPTNRQVVQATKPVPTPAYALSMIATRQIVSGAVGYEAVQVQLARRGLQPNR